MPTNNAINLSDQGVAYYNGTGVFSSPALTQFGVVVGDAADNITTVAAMTNGQVLIGSTGANPVPSTIGIGTGLSATGGPGSYSISVVGGGLTWSAVTGSVTLVVNNGFNVTSGAVVLTLPAVAAQHSIIRIALSGGTSFTVAQGAGQSIRVGSLVSTVGAGGSISSTAVGDCVELLCTTANTGWQVLSSVGNITVV
jgi:hypothetical protein